MTLLIAIIIFLELLQFIVIADVILSWLAIFWLNLRPQFLKDIIEPLYKKIKSFLPTTIWPIDFTPIVVIIFLWFLEWFLYIIFPELAIEIANLTK